MARRIVTLFTLILTLIALSPRLANATDAAGDADEQRLALVIGNSNYATSPLINPRNDANDIAAVLRTLGFEVILELDADQKTMVRAIREFGNRLHDKRGVGLFYFAGHGVQINGQNYLVPIGADIKAEDEIAYEGVNANRVLDKMDRAGGRVNMVILDACRNNPFERSFRSASRGLAQMQSPSGTLIAFATEPGNVALDGEGKNGVYTEQLLANIKTPGIDVGRMFRRVRAGVIKVTQEQQIPWESSSLIGDFYFVPPEPEPEQSADANAASGHSNSPANAYDPDLDITYWRSIEYSGKREFYESYLSAFPNGYFVNIARLKLREIDAAAQATSQQPSLDSKLSSYSPPATPLAPASPTPPPKVQAPPPSTPVSSADRYRIERLLELAGKDEQALRLTTPESSNAFDRYQEVLALEPGNAQARSGLDRIMQRYVEWAENAISRRDIDKAEDYLERAAKVQPDSPLVRDLQSRLSQSLPAPAAKVSGSGLVSMPRDGRLGGTRYTGSGKIAARIVADEAATLLEQVKIAPRPASLKRNLQQARRLGMEYLIQVEINHWEDRNTLWSGKSDRVGVSISVYRSSNGQQLSNTVIDETSSWSIGASSEKPEDLLRAPVKNYFTGLKRRFSG
jgi:tetratricopeptide (TPR) repeat protein